MARVSASDTAEPAHRRLALFQGILPLDKSRIPVEILAGVTLAALAIPEVMGYTAIAGMPVVTGLYTILLPVLVFAVLGSSRHLVVGRRLRHRSGHGGRARRARRRPARTSTSPSPDCWR